MITLDHSELEGIVAIGVTSAPTYNTNKSSFILPSSWHSSTDLDQTDHDLNLPVEHGNVKCHPLVVVEAVHLSALVHKGQDGV